MTDHLKYTCLTAGAYRRLACPWPSREEVLFGYAQTRLALKSDHKRQLLRAVFSIAATLTPFLAVSKSARDGLPLFSAQKMTWRFLSDGSGVASGPRERSDGSQVLDSFDTIALYRSR